MTDKEQINYNKMRNALIKISKGYQTASQLRKSSKSMCGLDYEEALEMAYENIQAEASAAVKGVKAL